MEFGQSIPHALLAKSRLTARVGETKTRRLITIAGPMAGHPDARLGAKGPDVIPSWRDLAPESDFMRRLRRKTLPNGLEYHLIYAYGNSRSIKLGENSDGVVPLSSQLCSEAQSEATAQFGFNDTHVSILKNTDAIRRVVEIIDEVKPLFPKDHLREIVKGGYKAELGKDYTPLEKYFILPWYILSRSVGKRNPLKSISRPPGSSSTRSIPTEPD